MHRTTRSLLALAVAAVLLLSACGSDDDGDSSDTTAAAQSGGEISDSADQDYCEAAIATNDTSKDDRDKRLELLEQQIETAPDELKEDLEVLKENQDALLDDPTKLSPDASAALQNVLTYQASECGINIGLGGG